MAKEKKKRLQGHWKNTAISMAMGLTIGGAGVSQIQEPEVVEIVRELPPKIIEREVVKAFAFATEKEFKDRKNELNEKAELSLDGQVEMTIAEIQEMWRLNAMSATLHLDKPHKFSNFTGSPNELIKEAIRKEKSR